MWIKLYSKFYPDVSPDSIWKVWVDISNWHKWHGDLEYCKLKGDFKAGNHFILKPKNMREVKIQLTHVNEGRSFTDRTNFFGASMFDTHSVESKKNGVLLSNKLVVTGPLRLLWIKLVAQHVANTVPDEMDALVNLARKI